MSLKYMFVVASAAGLILSGCGTTPENAGLLQAREQFSTLQSKPESSRLAALETKAAFSALGQAEAASLKDRKAPQVEQLVYLAQQKIALAEQTIELRMAQGDLQGIEAQRTQARLDVRTAQLKALQQLNAKQTDRGAVITFGDVLFDSGRAELKSGSLRNLEQLSEYLLANPERKVRVEGFTDSTGKQAFNQQLSEHRATAVAHALRRAGVSPERVRVAGYGWDYPVASNADAQSRQLNRRVEVIVSYGSNAVSERH